MFLQMPSAHINKTHVCCRYKGNTAFTSEKINPVGDFESYLHDYLSCLGLELSGKTWQSIEVGKENLMPKFFTRRRIAL